MSKLLEHIENLGYLIESTREPYDAVTLIRKDNNKKSKINYTKKTLYILGSHEVANRNEADDLALKGVIVKTTGIEIYDAIFEYSEDDKCKKLFNYGLKTKNYLDGCKAKIGCLKIDCGEELDELEDIKMVTIDNGYSVDVGKCKNEDIYCAQYVARIAIDDYMVVKYYFKQRPNIAQIELIDDISRIEQKLGNGQLAEEFTCWECGNRMHWVDTFNNFKDRKEALYNRCCCK